VEKNERMKTKSLLPTIYKKIEQKVLNGKVCVYFLSSQIFNFGIIKRRKDN
jgi:hypothetical protein